MKFNKIVTGIIYGLIVTDPIYCRLNVHEDQTAGYAKSKLKHLNNKILPFAYISTGEITKLIDFNDPKPRSREVFSYNYLIKTNVCAGIMFKFGLKWYRKYSLSQI